MNDSSSAQSDDPVVVWSITENPDLPRVLILGDSISVGYTIPVREALAGKANVLRPLTPDGCYPINCGSTSIDGDALRELLSERSWDAIHFNWGLHDIAYRHPDSEVYGNRDKINGTVSTIPEDYRRNLTKIVEILDSTGAQLIWASSTVVPEGEAGRFVGDEVKYNAIAREIMAAKSIQIDDLYEVTKDFGPELFIGPGDVHFTEEGCRIIASHVARAILTALTK